jgi:hypothetical protein
MSYLVLTSGRHESEQQMIMYTVNVILMFNVFPLNDMYIQVFFTYIMKTGEPQYLSHCDHGTCFIIHKDFRLHDSTAIVIVKHTDSI